MKDFDVSTITTNGAQLLAQATEGNRLVVSGCEANTTVYTAETAKAVTTPTGARISNEIELVSVQDNKIIIRARFTQSETTGGNANSLVLFGRLANDPEETRTAICVVSNNAQFYLPSSTSEAVQDFECLFTIDYEIQSNVVVEQTSALECSLAEFRLLKERTVTLHKEGDPNVGDPTQNIFGAKVFRSQIGFVAKANFTSVATFNGGIAVNGDAQFAEDATFNGNIILPDKTSDGFSAGDIQIGNLKAISTCSTISQNGVSFENEDTYHFCSTSYNSDSMSISGAEAPSFTVNSKELSWSEPGQSNTRFKITDDGELFFYQKNDKTFALTATNRFDEVTLTTDYVVCRKNLTSPECTLTENQNKATLKLSGVGLQCDLSSTAGAITEAKVDLGNEAKPFRNVYCDSIICTDAPNGLIREDPTTSNAPGSGLILIVLTTDGGPVDVGYVTDELGGEIYNNMPLDYSPNAISVKAKYSNGNPIQQDDGVVLLEKVLIEKANTPVYALAWKAGQ